MKKILYFILVLGSISVLAQEPLSLSDAVRLGLENNFDIKVESKNVEVSKVNNNWGNAGLFPSLTASFVGSKTTNDNIEAVNPFSPIGVSNTIQGQPSLNLNWNLLSIYNIKISKQRLEQLQAQSEGNADIVVANSLQSIVLGYFIAVLEEQRTKQFELQLNLSRDKFSKTQTRRSLGSAVTSEVLLEEGNYLTDSINYINQSLRYQNAISNLNFLLGGSDPNRSYILTDSLNADKDLPTYDELLVRMEQENVDIKKQIITQEVLGSDLELRQWERMPTLTVGANYAYAFSHQKANLSILAQDGSGTRDLNLDGYPKNQNYGVNFTIAFTLFNGGRINQAIQRAKITYEQGGLGIDRLKSQLRRDLKQALDQYEVRVKVLSLNERFERAAKINLEIATQKFSTGTIDSFDYRTVQNTYLNAAIQRLQSTYDLIDSKITLMRLTGGLIQEYNN